MRARSLVAFAGRRIDELNAKYRRFPLDNVDLVRGRIHYKLLELNCAIFVSAAACGADLIALEVAESLGVEFYIVLPTSREKFRQESVVDRPGDWGVLFDRLTGLADDQQRLFVNKEVCEVATNFAIGNTLILEKSLWLLSNQEPAIGSEAIALIAWDGVVRNHNDITNKFATEAKVLNFVVHEILTL